MPVNPELYQFKPPTMFMLINNPYVDPVSTQSIDHHWIGYFEYSGFAQPRFSSVYCENHFWFLTSTRASDLENCWVCSHFCLHVDS